MPAAPWTVHPTSSGGSDDYSSRITPAASSSSRLVLAQKPNLQPAPAQTHPDAQLGPSVGQSLQQHDGGRIDPAAFSATVRLPCGNTPQNTCAATEFQPDHLPISANSTLSTSTRDPFANTTVSTLSLKHTITPTPTHGPALPPAVEMSSTGQVCDSAAPQEAADRLAPTVSTRPAPFSDVETPAPTTAPSASAPPAPPAAPTPFYRRTLAPRLNLRGYSYSAATQFFSQELLDELDPNDAAEPGRGQSITCHIRHNRFALAIQLRQDHQITDKNIKGYLQGSLLSAVQSFEATPGTRSITRLSPNKFLIQTGTEKEGCKTAAALFARQTPDHVNQTVA